MAAPGARYQRIGRTARHAQPQGLVQSPTAFQGHHQPRAKGIAAADRVNHRPLQLGLSVPHVARGTYADRPALAERDDDRLDAPQLGAPRSRHDLAGRQVPLALDRPIRLPPIHRAQLKQVHLEHCWRGVNARNTGVYGAKDSPVPDIKIDGDDGPLTIPSTQSVSMTLSIAAGVKKGEAHDWWIGTVRDGAKLYCWSKSGGWSLCPGWSPRRAYGGPLIDKSGFVLHQGTIPQGSWRFFFAVDELNNLYEGTDKDTIRVTSY